MLESFLSHCQKHGLSYQFVTWSSLFYFGTSEFPRPQTKISNALATKRQVPPQKALGDNAEEMSFSKLEACSGRNVSTPNGQGFPPMT